MNRAQIGLNQSLIYIHPLPPLPTQFLYLPVLNSANQRKKLYLGRRVREDFDPLPHPQLTPTSACIVIWIQFGRQKK